uniref:Gustatory receptor n=1 Tax=Lutzomyia longipalpis TaxID=7200 RepID=A0A240SXQ6_LUTLO
MWVRAEACFFFLSCTFYYFNKFFGLAPFTYNSRAKKYFTSSPSVAYCSFLFIGTILFIPSIVYLYVISIAKNMNSLALYVGISQLIVQCSSSALIQCAAVSKAAKSVAYFNAKDTFREEINKMGLRMKEKFYFLGMIITANVLTVSKILLTFAFIVIFTHGEEFIVTFHLIIYIIPYGASTLIGCNFITEIISLRYFAVQINNQLRNSLNTVCDLPEGASKARRMATACQVSDQVDKLMILHSELMAIVAKFNDIETFILLLYYTNKFVELIMPIFFEYLMLNGIKLYTSNTPIMITGFVTSIVGLTEVTLTVACCKKLIDEMAIAGKILHNCSVYRIDERLKGSITDFSLQILHERSPFTVCGMFNVDHTLLYSMISSMTSYVILLVQFYTEGVGT